MSTRTLLAVLAMCGVVAVVTKTLIDNPAPIQAPVHDDTNQTTHIGVPWEVEQAMIGGAQVEEVAR
jgi:hypothetical protein